MIRLSRKQKCYLTIGIIILAISIQIGTDALCNAEAKKKNNQQALELLDAVIQLNLPEHMELRQIEICHISATSRSWNVYVFVIVKTQLTYQELVAQFEKQPIYLSHETTPLKVLKIDTYATNFPYSFSKDLENLARNSEDLFVLYCFAPIADNHNHWFASENPGIVWKDEGTIRDC